jgi:hypothetical protein
VIGDRLEIDFDLLTSFQYYNETKYIRRQTQISYAKIFVFEEVYILFHFNIILKHNGMSSAKIAPVQSSPPLYSPRNPNRAHMLSIALHQTALSHKHSNY